MCSVLMYCGGGSWCDVHAGGFNACADLGDRLGRGILKRPFLRRRCCAGTASWLCTAVERCRLRVLVMRSVVLVMSLHRCEGLKESIRREEAISLIVSPTTTSAYSLVYAQSHLEQYVAKIQDLLRRCSVPTFSAPAGPRPTPASANPSL